MEDVTVNAAEDPALANEIIAQALAQAKAAEAAEVDRSAGITPPPSGDVTLLGGLYNSFTGELTMTAEVRELNGEDEEIISRATDPGRQLLAILSRGVVKIGDKPATAELINQLLAGDREYLLMRIRQLTLGDTIPLQGPCDHCGAEGQFEVDLRNIQLDKLNDPANDRQFNVDCKIGKVGVSLPSGDVQKKLIESKDKTGPELDSILLRECIEEVNGIAVTDRNLVKRLGILDRREILKAIRDKNPGPRLDEASAPCTTCGQEVPIPLSLADVFRL